MLIFKVLLAGCIALWVSASKAEADVASPSKQQGLLERVFSNPEGGRALLSIEKDRFARLEVCFDKCDLFTWKGGRSNPDAWTFATLFVYQRGFGAANASVRKRLSGTVKELVKRSDYCHFNKADRSQLVCNWPEYASAAGIEVAVAAYDSGGRCVSSRSLKTNRIGRERACATILPLENSWIKRPSPAES